MRSVEDFDFDGTRGGPAKYDWAKLFNGETWELVQGEDFTCQPRMFRTQAYSRATADGKRVRVSIREDRVYLQARNGSGPA